jgi:serine/threonine protein kinase
MDVVVGERLGKYEVVGHLATGGMASVYLARLCGLGGFERHVVLKTLRSEDVADPALVPMFLDEARVVATLHHQHIAQVFEVGEDSGTYFLAMEYVHGETVRHVLETMRERGRQLPLDFCLSIVCACAAGLHHAHERRGVDGASLGIVHRDVTPSNVIASYDGSIKLIDFGIAKATTRTTITRSGLIKGKVGYMAPEQVRGYVVDRRSDVFSLGVLVYELTTQTRAFDGENQFEQLERTARGELTPPSVVCPSYPPSLERLVLRALEVDPDDRYPSALAMRIALLQVAAELGLSLGEAPIMRTLAELFGSRPEPWLVDPRRRHQLGRRSASAFDSAPFAIVDPKELAKGSRDVDPQHDLVDIIITDTDDEPAADDLSIAAAAADVGTAAASTDDNENDDDDRDANETMPIELVDAMSMEVVQIDPARLRARTVASDEKDIPSRRASTVRIEHEDLDLRPPKPLAVATAAPRRVPTHVTIDENAHEMPTVEVSPQLTSEEARRRLRPSRQGAPEVTRPPTVQPTKRAGSALPPPHPRTIARASSPPPQSQQPSVPVDDFSFFDEEAPTSFPRATMTPKAPVLPREAVVGVDADFVDVAASKRRADRDDPTVPRTTTPNAPALPSERPSHPRLMSRALRDDPTVPRTTTPNAPSMRPPSSSQPNGPSMSHVGRDAVAVPRTMTPNAPAMPRTMTPNAPAMPRTMTPHSSGRADASTSRERDGAPPLPRTMTPNKPRTMTPNVGRADEDESMSHVGRDGMAEPRTMTHKPQTTPRTKTQQ